MDNEQEWPEAKPTAEAAVEEPTGVPFMADAHAWQPVFEGVRREEKLSEVARAWTATFDAISDFVSVHDREFQIIKANRALGDLLGHNPKDLIGRRCYEVFHGTDEPWPGCPHVEAVQALTTVTMEVDDPGMGIPLLVTCSPLLDATGALLGSVHIARDISRQKRAEEEREQLIAELQEALSMVRMLSGLLPICASCKNIRDDEGQWRPVEEYIEKRTEAKFTHGICPGCARKLYPAYVR